MRRSVKKLLNGFPYQDMYRKQKWDNGNYRRVRVFFFSFMWLGVQKKVLKYQKYCIQSTEYSEYKYSEYFPSRAVLSSRVL